MHVRRHKKAVKGKWDDVFHKNDEVSEMSDLIAAISTPLSPSAIGILRLSGPGAAAAADRVFRARSGRPLAEAPSRTLVYGSLLDREPPPDAFSPKPSLAPSRIPAFALTSPWAGRQATLHEFAPQTAAGTHFLRAGWALCAPLYAE